MVDDDRSNEPRTAAMDDTEVRRLTRRQFVRVALLTVATALAVYGIYYFQRLIAARYGWERIARAGWNRGSEALSWSRGAHLSPQERLKKRFEFLNLDDEGVNRFIEDYEKHRRPVGRFIPPGNADQEFYHRYLLSTDFFQNGEDESRLVSYVMFFDPYASPCWNPCRLAA